MSVTAAPLTGARPDRARADVLRRYINLTRELAISQFKLRYTGSALGYLWSLFKPAMQFALMLFVFVGLFHVDKLRGAVSANAPDPNRFFGIQLLLGIVLWTFFAECTAAAMQSVAGTGHLIRKAYFPRSIMVIAASMTSLLTLSINLALVLLIAVVTHQIDVGWRILLVVPLMVELYVLVLGIALGVSALFVAYRDVGHLWEVLSQAIFWGSAVQYPFSLLLGHGVLSKIAAVNPVAQIMEDMRHAMVTPNAPWHSSLVGLPQALIPYVLVAAAIIIGSLTFRRMSPHFAENL